MNIFQTLWEGSCQHALSKSGARPDDKNVRFQENWSWSFSNHDGMVEKITQNLVVLKNNEKASLSFKEN